MAGTPLTTTRARLGGSSVTVFRWNGTAIAFARQVSVQTATPVGPGTVPIHPMDSRHPIELITPIAATMGAIVLEFYERFNTKVWDDLAIISGADDIVGIFEAVANTTTPITIVKHITPYRRSGGNPYGEQYNNCVVSTAEDGETIEVGTMEVLKRITVNYTHSKRV